MKVLVTGSRNWTDKAKIREVLEDLPEDTELILGDARGADTIAYNVWKYELKRAEPRVFEVTEGDWAFFGSSAGPRRNTRMILENPDLTVAFRARGKSNGTDDCATKAQMQFIPVEWYFEG